MGRDNSPDVRRRQQLARKQGRRASYDRILIVSEGSKTEPLYFKEIRNAYRLHTANVEVQPSKLGTAPKQVVQYACDLFKLGDPNKGIRPLAFEQVYAVFDRDEHPSYFDALNMAQALDGKLKNDNKQAVKFSAIASIPSFELWLLLHFESIESPLARDEVLRRVKTHIRGYEKGAGDAFAKTRDQIDIAIQRAERLAELSSAFNDSAPYTDIGALVKLLTKLRD